MSMGTIKQMVTFNASPHEVYEILMDSRKHAAFSGAEARIGKKVGDAFSVYDGWIKGKNVELVKDKKIVQEWWADDKSWPSRHVSLVTFVFTETKEGTKLVFTHSDIPSGWKKDLQEGWDKYYWEKMKEYLGEK